MEETTNQSVFGLNVNPLGTMFIKRFSKLANWSFILVLFNSLIFVGQAALYLTMRVGNIPGYTPHSRPQQEINWHQELGDTGRWVERPSEGGCRNGLQALKPMRLSDVIYIILNTKLQSNKPSNKPFQGPQIIFDSIQEIFGLVGMQVGDGIVIQSRTQALEDLQGFLDSPGHLPIVLVVV